MTQPQEPTLADLVIEDLERQLSESDPRYGRKCKELAVLRAQYAQLIAFLQSKKDILGLTAVDADGNPIEDSAGSGGVVEAEMPAKEGPAAEKESSKVNGSKGPEKPAPVT